MSHRYILLATGLAFLISWLFVTFYTIASESNFLVTVPLAAIQVLTFMMITSNYKVGIAILSLMAVSLLLSITIVSAPIIVFNVFLDVFFLTSLTSAILHSMYGFVKKERKTVQAV
ncbi:MAG: hypothetical protein ACREBU_08280 [Nitrososphaera sp.]